MFAVLVKDLALQREMKDVKNAITVTISTLQKIIFLQPHVSVHA
jgi:hypothetical protein